MQRRRQQFEADLTLKIRVEGYEFSHKSLFEDFVAKQLLELRDNEADSILKEDLGNIAILLLFSIGWVLKNKAKYAEALEYYLKALAIEEQVYGNDHPYVATSYNNIGNVLQDQSNYTEALAYFKKGFSYKGESLWQ